MLACLLAGFLTLGGLPAPALAASDPAAGPTASAAGTDSATALGATSAAAPTIPSLQPGATDDPAQIPSVHDGNEGDDLTSASSLPATYDSRDYDFITPVRNQGYGDICWSFGTIAAAEASMLKNGPNLGYTASTLDLSERHLAYFTFSVPQDPLHNTDGDQMLPRADGSALSSTPPCYLNTWGSAWMASNALWAQRGAVLESAASYEPILSYDWDAAFSSEDGKYDITQLLADTALDESTATNGVARLKGTCMINMGDVEEIKQAIMDFGAMAAPFYIDDDYFAYDFNDGDPLVTYNYDGDSGTNHIITIVGWDDTVSPSFFAVEPSEPGAWICKNSYGEDYGVSGYFLLSYEDACLVRQNAFAYEMEKDGTYQNLYFYDGTCSAYYNYIDSGGSIASVFEAKANAGGEELKAVSFFIPDVNVSYSCQVYLDPTDASDPTSGVPALSTPLTGKIIYGGIKRLNLSSPVTLAPGAKFSVVLTLSHETNDREVMYAVDANSNGSYQSVSFVAPGQSYERDSATARWDDLALVTEPDYGDEPTCCARIKAHTNNVNLGSRLRVNNATISEIAAQTYTGSALTPKPTVVIANHTLKEGTDYTLAYRNNTEIGTASVTITGKGSYSGSATKTFLIAPAFADVNASTSHAEDIMWLAGTGISTGWDEGDGTRTFRPLSTVKRCDMAAFLFRLAKQWGVVSDSYTPQTATMKAFTDVSASTSHYKEVLWLAETGVSTGWKVGSKAEFRPYQDVTRGQMAAFMYRLATQVAHKQGVDASSSSFFSDVSATTSFHDEIWWLAGNKVTEGWTVGSRREFRPNTTVKRCDMAAFLHRLSAI